jgi:hypothetical protein
VIQRKLISNLYHYRLVQKHYWWHQLRERLAFYKKKIK